MSMIGKAWRNGYLAISTAAIIAIFASASRAAETSFTAEVDRAQIGEDESVALSISVSSEGSVTADQLGYEAPDFESVNEYSSNFVRSFYDSSSGRFGMTHTQKLTKVLRPLKAGRLTIRKIQARIGGKMYTAPDIAVTVTPPGAGSPPPQQYGGGGAGLRGAGKRTSAREILLRAEVDKGHAYKGEQVVISYYLYRRVRVYNIQVDKFPELKGFLREEMEMPVMGTRLDSEQVIFDGVPYERSLLARYASYPLQEGKLRIDPIGLKYNYFASGGGLDDDGDPFFQFFRQSQPRPGSARSEPVNVDVSPLPADGRPSSFSGGVGDFNVVAAVDKYDVRANEAITMTVKVEGRGNLAAIGEPKAKWPDNLELYDSKGKVNSVKGGVGSKIFEFLLIPRVPGKVTLPPLEFSFFDPGKKAYVTTHTEAIEIQVGEPAPGSQAAVTTRKDSAVGAGGVRPEDSASKPEELRYLKSPLANWDSGGPLRWIYLTCLALSLALIGWLGFDLLRRLTGWGVLKGVKSARGAGGAEGLRQRLREAGKNLQAVSKGASPELLNRQYDFLSAIVLDALDQAYGLGARSLSRSELGQLLVNERGLEGAVWRRIERLLEYAEMVRFTGSTGVVSSEAAGGELRKWIDEAEGIVTALNERAAQSAST
jgi:hypothetical protein